MQYGFFFKNWASHENYKMKIPKKNLAFLNFERFFFLTKHLSKTLSTNLQKITSSRRKENPTSHFKILALIGH